MICKYIFWHVKWAEGLFLSKRFEYFFQCWNFTIHYTDEWRVPSSWEATFCIFLAPFELHTQHQAVFTQTQYITKVSSLHLPLKKKKYWNHIAVENVSSWTAGDVLPNVVFPRQSNGDSAVTDTRPSRKESPPPSSPSQTPSVLISGREIESFNWVYRINCPDWHSALGLAALSWPRKNPL